MLKTKVTLGVVLPFFLSVACNVPVRASSAEWVPMDELNAGLPESVRIYALDDKRLRIRAWLVRADLAQDSVRAQVVVADDEDLRETVSSLSEQVAASVIINGGYFERDGPVATHEGLLCIDGEWIQPSGLGGALGFDAEGQPDIAWAGGRKGAAVEFQCEPPAPGEMIQAPPRPKDAPAWPMSSVIQGKPLLALGGVAYGQHHATREPRTGAGVSASGELVLMVVDGRQQSSRGATLEELAQMMIDVGCVDVVNLDGGGSSTLIVGGNLVNRPQGGVDQREVMSALALLCEP